MLVNPARVCDCLCRRLVPGEGQPRARWSRWTWLLLLATGCSSVFPGVAPPQSTAINWKANLAPPPTQATAAFDLNLLRPAAPPPRTDTGDLLELTVWDLYEAGKSHTVPMRVAEDGSIDVPLLGQIPVRERTPAEIEATLITAFRDGEYLVEPRVLVRELASPPVKVYVTGAVNRPGAVELPRREATVFAALITAGGLARDAGTHILLARQDPTPAEAGATTAETSDIVPMPTPSLPEAVATPTANGTHPALQFLVNSGETLSVTADESVPAAVPAAQAPVIVGPHTAAVGAGKWYDLSRERDCQLLSELTLREGDTLTVKQMAPPVRLVGAVRQPGLYPLPAGNLLMVGDVISLAEGFSVAGIPVHVTLTRPATEDRGALRWSIQLTPGDPWPGDTPFVHPGDLIQVEPTKIGEFRRAVEGLRKR